MTLRRAASFGALVAAMAFIAWDPWLRFRDIDFHEGQHLAWVQHLAAGLKPGRDLCLSYGPLYSWSLLGFMRLTDWSVVGLRWYFWAAQTLGAVLAWQVLRSCCASRRWAAAGLGLYLIYSPAFLHWYGFTNGLRQMLALGAMSATLRITEAPRMPGWSAAARGGWLALALGYSPETGVAAVAGCLAAVVAAGQGGRHRWEARGWTAVGFLGVFGLILGVACSGNPMERLGAFTETSRQFLHGFLTLPWSTGPLGLVLAAILVLSSAAWLAVRIGGGPAEARHLALLVFGWAAFRGLLGRSDVPHVREAAPAVVVLLAMHADRGWAALRRIVPGWLRGMWRVSFAVCVAIVTGLTALRVADSLRDGAGYVGRPSILRSKSPAAFRIARDMQGAGLRTYVDLPRVGGLWLLPGQAAQITGITREILRRTAPGDRIYATPNAELYYFLADRLAANRFPVSLHAIEPVNQALVAASLEGCRIAVLDPILVDTRNWEWWLPVIGRAVRREFATAQRFGDVELAGRRPR